MGMAVSKVMFYDVACYMLHQPPSSSSSLWVGGTEWKHHIIIVVCGVCVREVIAVCHVFGLVLPVIHTRAHHHQRGLFAIVGRSVGWPHIDLCHFAFGEEDWLPSSGA